MKLTAKKIIAAVLCASAAMCFTGCVSEEEPSSTADPTGSSSPSATTQQTTTTNTLDDDVNNPVDITEFVDGSETLENPNLVYYSHYDMRVAGDIKPGVKLFEETYGGKIDYNMCAWNERLSGLQVLIASDASPDLVDRDSLTFPCLISKNVYEDLTDYIDLTLPQWAGYETLIDSFEWEGGHYYYPFTANALPNCLIYNKTLFDSLSLEDPRELYDNNNWTWETFKQVMISFVDKQPDALGGVYGLVGNDIVISTGTPLIGINNGVISNNFSAPEVERAAMYLEGLRKEKLAVRGDGMWSNEPAPLVKGQVGFLGVGQWKITDFCKMKDKFEVGFVPFPRDESADEYYYNTSTFGYMVPKGSKNIKGAAAFINIMRKCQVDPELRAVVDESIMNEKKYSEEQFEFLKSFEDVDKFHMVVDGYSGFEESFTTLVDDMMINLAFDQSEDQKSWAQLRAENEGIIEKVLEDYSH